MQQRPILPPERVHPAVRDQWATRDAETVQQAQAAVAAHAVVVLGMAHNPYVRRVRRALDAAGIAHHDIDHGSYLSQWRRRNALKLWSGWPTFPIVFVRGVLVGGADDTARLIASGELRPSPGT